MLLAMKTGNAIGAFRLSQFNSRVLSESNCRLFLPRLPLIAEFKFNFTLKQGIEGD